MEKFGRTEGTGKSHHAVDTVAPMETTAATTNNSSPTQEHANSGDAQSTRRGHRRDRSSDFGLPSNNSFQEVADTSTGGGHVTTTSGHRSLLIAAQHRRLSEGLDGLGPLGAGRPRSLSLSRRHEAFIFGNAPLGGSTPSRSCMIPAPPGPRRTSELSTEIIQSREDVFQRYTNMPDLAQHPGFQPGSAGLTQATVVDDALDTDTDVLLHQADTRPRQRSLLSVGSGGGLTSPSDIISSGRCDVGYDSSSELTQPSTDAPDGSDELFIRKRANGSNNEGRTSTIAGSSKIDENTIEMKCGVQETDVSLTPAEKRKAKAKRVLRVCLPHLIAFLTRVMICFSSVFNRDLSYIDPMFFSAWRCTASGIVSLLHLLYHPRTAIHQLSKHRKRDYFLYAITSWGMITTFCLALAVSSATIVNVVSCLNPVSNAILSACFHIEKISPLMWLGCAIAIIGVPITLGVWNGFHGEGDDIPWLGAIIMIANSFIQALNFIPQVKLLREKPRLKPVYIVPAGLSPTVIFGWAAFGIYGAASGKEWSNLTNIGTVSVGMAFECVYTWIIALWGIWWLVIEFCDRMPSPTIMGVYSLIQPFVTAIIEFLWFGTPIKWEIIVGGVLTCIGVAVVVFGRWKLSKVRAAKLVAQDIVTPSISTSEAVSEISDKRVSNIVSAEVDASESVSEYSIHHSQGRELFLDSTNKPNDSGNDDPDNHPVTASDNEYYQNTGEGSGIGVARNPADTLPHYGDKTDMQAS